VTILPDRGSCLIVFFPFMSSCSSVFSKSNAVSSGSAGKDADSVTGELAAVVSLDDTDQVILGALRRCKCAV
jgi:hypothetical protein